MNTFSHLCNIFIFNYLVDLLRMERPYLHLCRRKQRRIALQEFAGD